MALWDTINTAWNPEEETVNFGTRQCVVMGKALYDVVTVVTVESKGEPDRDPRVVGIASGNYLALAIDGNLHILCDNTVFGSFSFPAGIAQMCWDASSRFLFVVTEDGCLIIVFVPQLKLLPSQALPRLEDSRIVGLFVTETNPSEILVLNNKGFLVRLQNVDLSTMAAAIESQDAVKAASVQRGIVLQEVSLSLQPKAEVVYATLAVDYRGRIQIIASLDNNLVANWDVNSNSCLKSWPAASRVIQLQVTKCNRFLVCLTEEGDLVYLCRHTFLKKSDFSCQGTQFILAEFDKSFHNNQIFVYGNGKLVVKEFLGKTDYELNVGEFIRLITPQPFHCNLMFVEGSRNEGRVNHLRLRTLTEGQPSLKLQRMIQRGKFEEAVEFAKLFKLDCQLIYTAKAAYLMDKFSYLACHNDDEDAARITWTEWIDTLDCVVDVEFVVECCLKAAPPTSALIRSTLDYAMERVGKVGPTDQNEADLQVYELQLSEAHENLSTLELVYPKEVVNFWYSSIKKEYLNWFIHLLCKGDMTSALTLWHRHGAEISNDVSFSEEDLSSLLNSIPFEKDHNQLLSFLERILTDIVKSCMEYLPIVTSWIIAKAKLIEGRQKECGPENALEFSQTLRGFLTAAASPSKASQLRSDLQPLVDFIEDLKDLKNLRRTFKIPILLAHFTEKDKFQVVSQLLNYLQDASQVQNIFDNFLFDFMQRRNIESDLLILHHIEVLLGRYFKWWRSCSFKEEIVLTLVNFLRNTEMKCKAILKILGQAAVPWSDVMQHLADIGCSVDHPLSKEIRSQRSLVPLKSVFRLYDLRQFETNNYNFMDSVIGFILKQQKETCLEDALLVARSCAEMKEEDIYPRYLFHLLRVGKADLMLSQLRNYTQSRKRNFIELYLMRIRQDLIDFSKKQTRSVSIHLESLCSNLSAVLECCSSCYEAEDWALIEKDAKVLLKIRNLGKTYNVFVSPSQYHDPKERKRFFTGFCSSTIAAINMVQIEQVAFLLDVAQAEALELLAQIAAGNGMKDLALVCSKQLLVCENSTQTAEACYRTAHLLVSKTSAEAELQLKNDLACRAATHCHPEQLIDATVLSHWTRVIQSVFSKFAIGNTSQEHDTHFSNPSYLCGVHQDYTVPILNQTILERIVQVLLTVLPEARIHQRPYQSSLKVFQTGGPAEKAQLVQELATVCSTVIKGLKSSQQLICALKCALALEEILVPVVTQLPDDWQAVSLKACTETREQLASQLLMRMLSAKKPDVLAAMTCLLILGPQTGYDNLTTLTQKFAKDRRLYPVAFLGYYFSICCSHADGVRTFQDLLRECHWNRRLAKFNVSLTDSDAAQAALNAMVLNIDLDVRLLSEFCASFNLKLDAAAKSHVQYLLSRIVPSLPAADMESLCNKIKDLVDHFFSPSEAYDILRESCSQISPYNYEFWLFMYELLHSIDMTIDSTNNAPELPVFLLSYQRKAPPGHNEKTAPFFRLQGSELANKRLPYFYQLNPALRKAIYQVEFDLDNWRHWVRLASFIEFRRDEICANAIYNSARSPNRPDADTFFALVRQCLDRVEDRLLAIACTENLQCEMGTPEEKLAAAKLQMDLAAQWAASDEQEALSIYNRSVAVCQKLETEQILRHANLADQKYMKLSNNGSKLVRILYEDVPADYQTINHVVDNICDVYAIPSNTLRASLIDEWLSPVDEFIGAPDDSFSCQSDAQNQRNLERVICILYSNDLHKLVAVMLEKANNPDNISASTYRHRALSCLQAVLKDDEVRSLLDMTPNSLDLQVKCSNFIHRLELLGLPFRPEEFDEADKASLIQILLQNGALTAACVVLAADLAIAFRVTKKSLWVAILNGIVKLNMTEKARWVVQEISAIPLMWKNPVVAPAWNLVVQDPFRNTDQLNEKQCLEALDMLWKCPIVRFVDIVALENLILTGPFPYLALLLLPFQTEEKGQDLLKRTQSYGPVDELYKKIEEKCSGFQHFLQLKAHLY